MAACGAGANGAAISAVAAAGFCVGLAAYLGAQALAGSPAYPVDLWASPASPVVRPIVRAAPYGAVGLARRPHPLPTAAAPFRLPLVAAPHDAAPQPPATWAPLAAAITLFAAVVTVFRHLLLTNPSPVAMAAVGEADGEAEGKRIIPDVTANLKAGFDSARAQLESAKAEAAKVVPRLSSQLDTAKAEAAKVVPILSSQIDTAKSQIEVARVQMETAKAQLRNAKAEMVPKLRAEVDNAKAQMDTAKAQISAARGELYKLLDANSPLPSETRVGWLMQNAIGQIGFFAQLALSVISSGMALFAVQHLPGSLGSWLGMAFTVVSTAAAWVSVAWSFQCYRKGRALRGVGDEKDVPAPGKDEVLTLLWNGLSINAYGLLAALFGIEANTGVLFSESLTAGLLSAAPHAGISYRRGISPFDVFAQVAQVQALLALSLGLILSLIALKVASQTKPADQTA